MYEGFKSRPSRQENSSQSPVPSPQFSGDGRAASIFANIYPIMSFYSSY